MSAFFLTCFVIGAIALVLQLVLGVFGAHDGHGAFDHHESVHGLDLLSVRALSAALGFFGLVGYGVLRGGLGVVLAIVLAVISGLAAAAGIASIMRGLKRLEVDKSFDISRALGLQGQVYLSIPANRGGAGKVHVNVHDRLIELAAVTADEAIPSGTDVLVVDAASSDTVVVTRAQPLLSEISDVQ
ncbi:MAG: hypothetical protein ACT4P7_02130 [Gemmatimonadaceae bacterium]